MDRGRNRDEPDFRNIRLLSGSQPEGFEEFCCQIARQTPDVPAGSRFQRNYGAGGDAGVECFFTLPDGSQWAWQAKYFFEFGDTQQRQLTNSVEAALTNYPSLVRYTICLPFNLTGRTGRRTGQDETYRRLQERWEARSRELGREVEFVRQGKSELLDALLAIDRDGARHRFWFGNEVLAPEWFDQHLRSVEQAAGPRYSAALSVDVPIATAFEALGKTETWRATERNRVDVLVQARDRWAEAQAMPDQDRANAGRPESAGDEAGELSARLAALVECLSNGGGPDWVDELRRLIQETRDVAATCEYALVEDLERTHGPGTADSVSFRQFQAEVGRSFPARFLDATRELIRSLDELAAWAHSPGPSLPAAPAMLVHGIAGTGKTHAVCDAAMDRQRRGLRSIVILGEQLHDGEPWDQIRVILGFGADVSRDLLLGMLDVAGETSAYPLIIFVDALNETTPRDMWKRFLTPMLEQASRYPWLKVCLSCRTSYLDVVLPKIFDAPRIEHEGFAGVEFEAFTQFFDHYGIASPATPLLQPEFANPLFLRLVCEALQASEDRRIPDRQLGLDEVVRLLLEDKNRRVSEALDYDARERLVPRAIEELVGAMASGNTRQLRWEVAKTIVDRIGPSGTRAQSLFDRLIGEGLLIEEHVYDPDTGAMQDVVRIAFERLAEFLVAEQLLSGLDAKSVHEAFAPDGRLHFALADHEAVAAHSGLLEVLAILLPERHGLELTKVPIDEVLIGDLRRLVCSSLLWRSPESISEQTATELREALQSGRSLFPTAMDALLALSTRPGHPLNARWGHQILADVAMPDRDAVLCPYLHYDWGEHRGVDRLVQWALDGNLADLDEETADLWATQLAWFLAANDRRVRDHATKAIMRLLDQHPAHCASVLARFTGVDDDYVIERCLAACYGALLRRRDNEAIRATAAVLWDQWFQSRRLPQNALVRDYARLIMELAFDHDVLPAGTEPETFRPPYDSEWPLTWPSRKDIEHYKEQGDGYPRLYWSCLEDDFLRYTIVGAFGYETIAPSRAGRWILQHVVDMGYTPDRFAEFDWDMIRTYGSGRSRPGWAERIGKKYQWIALYRLRAHVADHVLPDDAASDPEELPDVALQAVGQRNIDTTHWLRPSVATEPDYADFAYDFASTDQLSDEAWLRQGAVPDTRSLLLNPRPCQGIMILPMSAKFRSQSQSVEDVISGRPFREVVVHLSCYLVHIDGLQACLARLNEMSIGPHSPPEAESLNPTFLGEYPTTVEARRTLALQAWHPDSLGFVPELVPAEYRIVNDFELDAFTGKALSIHVPAPVFFERDHLKWDGSTAFLDADGRPAFVNPSTDGWDPVFFVVEFEYLRRFLRANQLVALWLEQVSRTAIADGPPGRQYIDIVRCHVFDGEKVDTVIERITDSLLEDLDSSVESLSR